MPPWKRALFFFLIVGAGVGVAFAMVKLQSPAKRGTPAREAPAIDVVVAAPAARRMHVPSMGVVRPSRRITVVPQVGGKVVYQSDNLVPGGILRAGEVMIRIDPREYELGVDEARGRVRQAELDLEIEQGRGEVARREWELLGETGTPDSGALALRKPQLETMKQHLESAKSALERARLALSQTTIRAPWDALVSTENVDVGQVVAPGRELADLAGIDRFWVEASVPVETLANLTVPGPAGGEGSPVTVTHELDKRRSIVREGRVLGLAGGIDPATRTARLLVGIDDPLSTEGGRLPLLPGAFVSMEIVGHEVEQVVQVPRTAIVEGEAVWIAGADGKLARRDVDVAWADSGFAYVAEGIRDGERVMVTRMGLPIAGMEVDPRVVDVEVAAGNPDAIESPASDTAEGGGGAVQGGVPAADTPAVNGEDPGVEGAATGEAEAGE
ncbi:efflux RND transporter periplasmic adaptor subunit [bacterium]|nr:efflux RND transporter periplasmic adaptor subunit [bacterium]